ncbi:aminotransferase class V-fold PLP-dependent enzyme [Solirubrobacter phytolaccae]|uniref:Aminotransferase class V-fold PLP-dependent enzyme n=1 Tax=Solirubrobacter phytolaccae TaxID=1404360 RepID=A0A9X3SAX5_9ACTN|nr:aminotransferase class V-fold PLP-dependent enzyme [Solirubrobacter phytolaccae]MDA0182976.1 aminotransferase class V-fold PLP-dependent enzyme [Solirubrobacter phytolaccae]
MGFRDEFPVLQQLAYLNAGTDGPIPRAAAEAARAELDAQLTDGRLMPHFERRHDLGDALRTGYARVLGCAPEDVAVTSGTTAGLGVILAGLAISAKDEIITSDAEHPGLIGPLIAARHRGATVKEVPIAELANAVTKKTTLVAASHVSWITGEVAPAELADVPVPVILDGAQGAGAIAVDVHELGCVAYAGPGQKWLCGADGTGMLYLDPDFGERVRTIAPTYFSFEDTSHGLDSSLKGTANRFDLPLPREAVALSKVALDVLEAEGLETIYARGVELAHTFATRLADAGFTVAPRGATTLVTFEVDDPEARREQLNARGVAVRNLPGTPYLRASVGAWNDESDLDRLLKALKA